MTRRDEAIIAAQETLTAMLDGTRSISTIHDRDAYSALSNLRHTRDNITSSARHMKDTLDHAIEHVNGRSGRFNSLGILQGAGPGMDVLCAKFALQSEHAMEALVRYYEEGGEL